MSKCNATGAIAFLAKGVLVELASQAGAVPHQPIVPKGSIHPVRDDGTTLAEPGKHVSENIPILCSIPTLNCPQKLKQRRASLIVVIGPGLLASRRHASVHISIFSSRRFTCKESKRAAPGTASYTSRKMPSLCQHPASDPSNPIRILLLLRCQSSQANRIIYLRFGTTDPIVLFRVSKHSSDEQGEGSHTNM